MSIERVEIKRQKQLRFSFLGLLAGNAFILLYFFLSAIQSSFYEMRMRSHIGSPVQELSWFFHGFLQEFLQFFIILCGIFSFVGWILIGMPFALLVPGRSIARLPWPFWILAGALLGPLAVLIIFLILDRGHLDGSSFAHTGIFWIVSVVIAVIAFVVYGMMLRWEIHAQQRQASTSVL